MAPFVSRLVARPGLEPTRAEPRGKLEPARTFVPVARAGSNLGDSGSSRAEPELELLGT